MSTSDIVRAWKDAEYRDNLSAEERILLPEHPAGSIEVAQLAGAQSGADCFNIQTGGQCLTIDFICPVTPLSQ